MPHTYDTDLAHVHDRGYGGFARGSAPGLVTHLHEAGITSGRVVDLGCGSGIWAEALVAAGYEVVGVDISPAMVELARQRVPQSEFHVGSFSQFDLPPCRAVTALGEVFNYLFDGEDPQPSLEQVCRRAYDALSPGGLLVFDVAGPGRCRGMRQAFSEGEGWTCLVEYRHDEQNQQLTRRIVTFRQVGEYFRRHEETHTQQLFEEASVVRVLEGIGFQAQTVQSYGKYPLAEGVVGFVARRR